MSFSHYSHQITAILDRAEATQGRQPLSFDQSLLAILDCLERVKQRNNKIILIGNGGSAAIANHLATDFWKRAGIRATSFSDSSMLTCVSNDFSYAEVFSKPIEQFADEHDLLFAISSSGNSPNILNGVQEARRQGCMAITLSGFSPSNALRHAGDLNLFIPGAEYGWVEIGHTVILHYLCDKFLEICDKTKQSSSKATT